MYYRCRACGREAEWGFLPSASCGMYGCGLLTLSVGCLWGVLKCVLYLAGDPRAPGQAAPVKPVPVPWWAGVISCGVVLVVVFVGMLVINFVIELIEWLAFARRRPCPKCGARRWSWGYTQGFGL